MLIDRRTAIFGALALGSGYLTRQIPKFKDPDPVEIPYSRFLEILEDNALSKIIIEHDRIIAEAEGSMERGFTRIPDIADKQALLEKLLTSNAEIWQQTKYGRYKRIAAENLHIVGALTTGTLTLCAYNSFDTNRRARNLERNTHADYRKSVAYHEAGHAITGFLCPVTEPVGKITIKPKENFMGYVQFGGSKKIRGYTYEMCKNELIIDMAGRAAEIVGMGEDQYTTLASYDLINAKHMATEMVMDLGMSKKIGNVPYGTLPSGIFSLFHAKTMTEKKAEEIEAEITHLIDEALQSAIKILTEHKSQLHLLAEALLERQTLSADEARRITGIYDEEHPAPATQA